MTGKLIKEIKLEMDLGERVRIIEVDDEGIIVFLTDFNALIITT